MARKGILGTKLGMTQVFDEKQPGRPPRHGRQGRTQRGHPHPHARA